MIPINNGSNESSTVNLLCFEYLLLSFKPTIPYVWYFLMERYFFMFQPQTSTNNIHLIKICPSLKIKPTISIKLKISLV